MRLLVVFSGADAGKICRYYHKRRAFFMEYLSTKNFGHLFHAQCVCQHIRALSAVFSAVRNTKGADFLHYHKRRAFFMEYLSTKMLTNFRQEWYSHYGDIMRFSIDVRTVEG